ncbi:MAG: PPC domain-containing protein [Limisphaerales bacterium]
MPLRSFKQLLARGSLAVVLGSLTASAVEPFASYIFPAGGQRGTTVSFRVGGCYFHGEAGFEMLGPGVTASARVKEANTVWFEGPLIVQPASQRSEDYPRDHAGSVRIAADAPVGVRHWRAWTSQGATPAMKFIVGDLPEILEAEVDGEPIPVAVTPPLTINGRIFPREDVDVWTFKAKSGQAFTLALAALSIGSPLQARLVVLDPAGRPLQEAIASQRADPTLHFTAPSDGTYSVRVDDVNSAGLQNHVYRLAITDQPVVTRVFPLGGQRGESVKLELTGHALQAKQLEVKLPATGSGTASIPVVFTGKATATALLELDDLPEKLHAGTPCGFTGPAMLNGRITAHGSTNTWCFTAKKGDALDLTLASTRLGSPLTPVLAITEPSGKSLARAEATPGELSDLTLNFKAPADGDYRVHVSERFASRGGPDFAYRLRVAPPSTAPDFQLTLGSDTLAVIRETADGEQPAPGKPKRGSKQQPGKLKVNVLATGGFKGDIELTVEGLPSNVTVSGTKISGGRNTTDLSFSAEHAAKINAAHLTVRGTATVNGETLTRTAILPSPRGERAVDSVLLAVTLATPFKTTSDFLMNIVPRGSSYRRPYGIERGGFAGPLIAQLADRQGRHLQGVTAHPVGISPGDDRFEFEVTFPPGMELGRTSRSQVMLLGTIRDHDGSDHILSYSQNEQNDQVITITQAGMLELELDIASVRVALGGSVKIPFHLRRDKSLRADAVRVELQPPAHVAGLRAAAVTVPAGSDRGVIEIHFASNAGPFNLPCPIRATTLDAKHPNTAEAFIEFVKPAVAQTSRAQE